MQAYFWGTRGSLPVAPDGVAIREKIRRALLKANGRRFDNAGAAEQFIDAELEFPVRSTYGGNSSCMEILGGDYYTCCDMKLPSIKMASGPTVNSASSRAMAPKVT